MAPIEFNRWLGVGEVRMNKDYALVEGNVLEVQRRTTSLVGAGRGVVRTLTQLLQRWAASGRPA